MFNYTFTKTPVYTGDLSKEIVASGLTAPAQMTVLSQPTDNLVITFAEELTAGEAR